MLVLLVSFLLVIVATIFLLSGLFLTDSLGLIFVSIACSALAGIVLVLAVMKSKPRPSTTAAAGGEGEVPAAVGVGLRLQEGIDPGEDPRVAAT